MDFTRTGPLAALRYLAYSVRNRGFLRTCLLGYREWRKELKLGISTLGMSQPCASSAENPGAHIYQPSSSVIFGKAVQQLGIAPQGLHLLDVGCGKGRVMVLAAEVGFARVTGIDLDPALCATAMDNIYRVKDRYPNTKFDVVEADAVAFGVSDDVDVAYLFNPFDRDIVKQWLDNVIQGRQRPLHIIYMHPVHKDVMTQAALHTLYDDPSGEFSIFIVRKRPVSPGLA